MTDPALAVIGADALRACATRLARVAGTHALMLDGIAGSPPAVAGVACWTVLHPDRRADGWNGMLRAAADALPFGDDSFCAVLARFACGAGSEPEALAGELARVLAPHGVLLVAGLHPHSLWRAGIAPGRWERALRAADLDVAPAARCGAPWRRSRGESGLPGWLVHATGGAYVIEAHRRVLNTIPLRRPASTRRAAEATTLVPGAHRQCA